MSYSLLDHFLLGQLSAFLMILCRTGSALMLIPGFGEVYIPQRIKLVFALFFSALLTPLLQSHIPTIPGSAYALFLFMSGEIMVGLFIGFLARTMLSVVHVAGSIIALQSSLSVATIFDPSSGNQSAVISNVLTLASLVLFFTLNLHHLVLAALAQSYDVFSPGHFPNIEDMSALSTRLVGDSFTLGVMLAAPHIVMSLLFYLAGGLMGRLMPNFQVFFVMMSPQIMIALFLLFAILPMLLEISMRYMQEQIGNFVNMG